MRKYAIERRNGRLSVNLPVFAGAVAAGLLATRLLGFVFSGDVYYLVGFALSLVVLVTSVVRTRRDFRQREDRGENEKTADSP